MIHEYNKVEQSYVETVSIMEGEGGGSGGDEGGREAENSVKSNKVLLFMHEETSCMLHTVKS